MNKLFFVAAAFLVAAASAFSQQALKENAPVVSPEINADTTVTFRLYAPNATEVNLQGDFIEFNNLSSNGIVPMVKVNNKVWEYTTSASLKPELYSYTFNVDGMRVTDPANVYSNRDIATVTNYFIIGGDNASLYEVNDVPHGTLARVWYDSPSLGMKRRMTVYTPPGYETGKENYPVLYLLHGAGGDEEAWPALGRTAQILDNLIANGQVKPMIVVMPNGNPTQEAAPGETHYGLEIPTIDVSRMNRGTYEAAFPDIVNFLDRNYRTIPDKKHRAIAGLSMGGYHSMHISKNFPDMFDYVGLYSAAIRLPGDEDNPVYADMESKLRTQFDKEPALYWIAIGKDDFLYEDNVKFRELLDRNKFPYVYVESEGGHIWRNWRNYLTQFTPLLFK